MPNKKLAIHGGEPVLIEKLKHYKSIGIDEKKALCRVIDSGSLSGFYGSWGPEFFGGEEVKQFENEWAQKFNTSNAISVNSNTSGLYASMGAIGISPGDEIIVPPYSMSATAMAPIIYGGIPVFADIEEDTFCLDIKSVKRKLSNKTKAVITVNLFGHPSRLFELKNLCKEHNLFLIEDNAQAPLAKENNLFTGTIGDIGVFSLNYHKHIHTGEGGVCTTDNEELALKLRAIRNHGENIINDKEISPINMIGFNYRMTEMCAAIGRVQLSKIASEVEKRKEFAQYLTEGISDLEGIAPPYVRNQCDHVYYIWAVKLNPKILGISRELFSKALSAEGFPHFNGYVKPLYLLPTFQQRIGIGREGWPFTQSNQSYEKGICPVTEELYENQLICFETCSYELNKTLANSLINAFRKVYLNKDELKE